MTTPTLAPCPIETCHTMLQPYRGRLSFGISQHLQVVHQLPEPTAVATADSWVQAGCRASR